MLFDSHAHYDSTRFDSDRHQLLASMPDCGVGRILNAGCDLASSRAAAALAHQYGFLWAAVGSHPDDADHVDDALLEEYRRLAADERVVAIGEIGLDYHYEDVPREIQKQAFIRQLELARELVSLGWYVGFTGVLTFKNARKALEVAENVPLYRLLLETDCPYMAPEPFRGRRCDSGMLHRTAEKLAELRGVSPEEIARITWENASRLFRIKL